MWRFKIVRVFPHQKLIDSIKEAYNEGGWEAAREVCRNTKGSAAFLAHELLDFFQTKMK